MPLAKFEAAWEPQFGRQEPRFARTIHVYGPSSPGFTLRGSFLEPQLAPYPSPRHGLRASPAHPADRRMPPASQDDFSAQHGGLRRQPAGRRGEAAAFHPALAELLGLPGYRDLLLRRPKLRNRLAARWQTDAASGRLHPGLRGRGLQGVEPGGLRRLALARPPAEDLADHGEP